MILITFTTMLWIVLSITFQHVKELMLNSQLPKLSTNHTPKGIGRKDAGQLPNQATSKGIEPLCDSPTREDPH